MRILLIHQFYLGPNDSGGSRFNEFVKNWSEKGHEITVLAGNVNYTTGLKDDFYKGKYIHEEKVGENIRVLRCDVSEEYNNSFLGRLKGYFSFNVSSTIALFKVKKPDIIIVTSPPLFVGLTGIIAKFLKKKPLIFEVRDLWPESAIDTGVLRSKFIINIAYMIEKLSYRNADIINVLTPAFKNKLIKTKNVKSEKLVYVPNGADTDIFVPQTNIKWVRDKYELNDKFLVTYMGAHGLANNLISLLKVAEYLDKKDNNIHFMLIGDGMKKQELIAYAKEKELSNVTFVDAQPKSIMPDYCNSSDICTAILQKNDTFKTVYPNKVFDYMSCKKPVLIGIDGIARELVEENHAGVYIDPENPVETGNAIVELSKQKDLLKKMGENGYEFVIKNFERKSLANNYLEVMEELVNA